MTRQCERNKRRQELHQPHVVYIFSTAARALDSLFLRRTPDDHSENAPTAQNAFFCGRHQGGVGAVAVHTLQFNARANIGVQGRHLLDVLLRISWSALMGAHWRRKYTLLDERRTREKTKVITERAALEELREQRESCWSRLCGWLAVTLAYKMTCNSVTLAVLMPSFFARSFVELHYFVTPQCFSFLVSKVSQSAGILFS